MSLPWDKYEYSEPFPVAVHYGYARYFCWRRNLRTNQYSLEGCSRDSHTIPLIGAGPAAPNPLELLPPVLKNK